MLPWEVQRRTLDAPIDDVLPMLELLAHEADVATATAGLTAEDYWSEEADDDCPICNPSLNRA